MTNNRVADALTELAVSIIRNDGLRDDTVVPKVEDLAAWLNSDECPDSVINEVASRMKPVLCSILGIDGWPEGLKLYLQELVPGEDGGQVLIRAFGSWESWPVGLQDRAVSLQHGLLATGCSIGVFDYSVGEILDTWENLPKDGRPGFPLAPLVRGWFRRVLVCPPERRRRRISAEPLRWARPTQIPFSTEGAVPSLGAQPGVVMPLPGLEQSGKVVVPALPLQVSEFSSGGGRGAPVTPRLWFGFQLAVPPDRRDGLVTRLPVPLRDVIGWLWPRGWVRSRDIHKLREGMRGLYQMGIVYDRREWLLVRPVALPTENTGLDDELLIDVESLPGGDRGPMIDTRRLWDLGAKAGVAWRAWIRLTYLWDTAKTRNGGFRIYATRPEVLRDAGGGIVDANGVPVLKNGRPVTAWNDPRAVHTGRMERNPQADRVPMLGAVDLAHLGYDDSPVTPQVRRWRASETRRWLRNMEEMGTVVLEWDNDDVRVLEVWSSGEE